jgi:hypothetical protein
MKAQEDTMRRGFKLLIAVAAVGIIAGWAIPHFIRAILAKSAKPDFSISFLIILG